MSVVLVYIVSPIYKVRTIAESSHQSSEDFSVDKQNMKLIWVSFQGLKYITNTIFLFSQLLPLLGFLSMIEGSPVAKQEEAKRHQSPKLMGKDKKDTTEDEKEKIKYSPGGLDSSFVASTAVG